ncbi:MAG: MaoC/PaaZ C-terminal domain-containing protein [Caulobacteraceae bacterium]|nr:MaoC/PaaZ C-terminal domain-containing protein [Caulobacteraceae bacterium]
MTAKTIIMGAAASRDWQPQHHDSAFARGEAGLPDVIMNNYTQAGFISRFVTDWSGPHGRIGRLKLRMRRPICPGVEMVVDGTVESVLATVNGFSWVDLAVVVGAGAETASLAEVRIALPATAQSPSPWACPPALWAPAFEA